MHQQHNTHNDFDVWVERLDSQSHAGDEAAAPHRDHHGINVGHLLHNLQAHRALPGDDLWVVVSAME